MDDMMWCQCNYKSNIRTDCIHYHCEHDMGASIDCCTLRGLGDCPCSNDCKDYINKNEVYRLGIEVLKKRNEQIVQHLPSAQPDYDKIIAEIKQCITETREHGKHHAKFVQDNGELYISGLEMALSIIEENR